MIAKDTYSRAWARRGAACSCFLLLVCLSCVKANGQATPPAPPTDLSEIRVFTSVIDPKVVSDIFGKRVAQRFVAIQITVANQNSDYQFLIHDVSLDLRYVFGKEFQEAIKKEKDACDNCRRQCMARTAPLLDRSDEPETAEAKAARRSDCEDECVVECSADRFDLSSLELSLIRGVAEKGQGEDTRNKVLRYFRALGTIAAGVIGVASFGPSYPKSVAVFNGPVINAYSELYPDYTINQMNRLSDSAYKSNTLVPKQQAKVLVAFIPQAMFLTAEQRKAFWEEPTRLYGIHGSTKNRPSGGTVDFRRTVANVVGSFIVEIENLPPLVTGVSISPDEASNFLQARPVVKGSIVGRFLAGSEIDLLTPPEGMDITLDGEPTENRINFIITSDRPVPSGTTLNFHVFKDQGSQTISKQISFTPAVPTLNSVTPSESAPGASGLDITFTGSNFIQGVTTVVAPPGSLVQVVPDSVAVVDSNTLKAKLNIDANATGVVRLKVMNGTTESNRVEFTVKAP